MTAAVKYFPIKPLAAIIALSFSSAALAANQPNGPFADVPLHLQQKSTSTSGVGVKPNVMLQIDDSGSMDIPVYIRDQNGNITNLGSAETRMNITKKALERLVQNPEYRDKFNWNMITLCNTDGSKTNSKVFSALPTWKFGLNVDSDLLPAIRKLKAYCNTPSTSRYLDSLHILQTALEKTGTYRCQKSYLVLFSDGDSNDGLITIGGTASTGFKVDKANDIWHAVGRNRLYPVTESRRDLYLAPDQPTFYTTIPMHLRLFDPNTGRWNNSNSYYYEVPGLFGSKNKVYFSWGWSQLAAGFFADSVYNHDLRTGGWDAAGKSWDDPDVNGGKQIISTFSIGFGDGLSAVGRAYLNNAATGNNYTALNANSPAELDAAFRTIFDQVNEENKSLPPSSFSSISPTLSGDETEAKVPQLAAAVRLDLQSGSSEVRFYDVRKTPTGGLQVLNTYKTPDFSGRQALIHDGQTVSWLHHFKGSNTVFGIPPATSNGNEWQSAMIPWLNRSTADNSLNSSTYSLKYRSRAESPTNTRNMGDVIAAPIHSYGPQKHGRQQFFITAANDGMVYLFESSNQSNHPYSLRLNYIPAGMERESADDTLGKHFSDIVSPNYITDPNRQPHRYMINGGLVIRTTDNTGPQRMFIAGNMGQGGRGTYALNLGGKTRNNTAVGLDSNQNDWPVSVPLFETPKGRDNKMGYTVGAPQIGRVAVDRTLDKTSMAMRVNLNNVRYATFIGSGTRNPDASPRNGTLPVTDNTETALYVYNTLDQENVGLPVAQGAQAQNNPMKAGALIKKVTVPNATSNRGGLMQPTLLDMDLDGVVDIAYAADFHGGLYRFDLRGTPEQWSAHKIFQAQAKQVITGAPAVYRREDNKYIVAFGTGSDLYQTDLSNTDIQSVYGIYEDLTNLNPAELSVNNLLRQTVGNSTTSGKREYRSLSNNEFQENRHQGWYFNLPAGERVVVKPDLLLKTLVLTTRNYSVKSNSNNTASSNDPCMASSSSTQSKGESWLMQVKVDNGGNIQSADSKQYAYIDVDGSNTNRDKHFRPQNIFAGFKMVGGGILNYALTVGGNNPNVIGHAGNSTTGNGDSGGTGTDAPLKEGGQKVRSCLPGSDHRIYLSDSSGAQGVDDPLDIYGQVCTSGVQRVAWRELF